MQKTHDFASSSTPLCKQRSRGYKSQEIQEMQCAMRDAANSRCCLHQYAPPQRSNAYLCWPQILQKRYKLNWNAEDSMRRKIGSNAILQEILKMQLVTGDVANSWGSSLQIWPKNCKIVMLLSAMHLNRPWTRLTEAWGACKAQWNCKFPGRSAINGRMQKKARWQETHPHDG